MTKIKFKKISFADGINHLQGKKIVPALDSKKYKCEWYPQPPQYWSIFNPEIVFFDDNTCMTTVSDWSKGYYGDIDANDPLFYLGTLHNED